MIPKQIEECQAIVKQYPDRVRQTIELTFSMMGLAGLVPKMSFQDMPESDEAMRAIVASHIDLMMLMILTKLSLQDIDLVEEATEKMRAICEKSSQPVH